jgi:hypothetical protein
MRSPGQVPASPLAGLQQMPEICDHVPIGHKHQIQDIFA